jgi:O-antigen/teichoic acid export membrane protein
MFSRYLERFKASPLAKNTSWLFAGQALSLVIQAGYFVIVARLLGRYEFGLYTAAVALVAMASQFSALGSGFVFIQFVSQDLRQFAVYWGNILMSTLGVGTLICAGVFLVGPHLIRAGSALLFLVVAISECICQQLTTSCAQVFQTFDRMRITATMNTSVNAARLVAALLMLLTFHKSDALHWAMAALSVSSLAMGSAVLTVLLKFGKPTFSLRLFASKMHDGFIYSLSGSTTTVYNDIDKVFLGHYGMEAANGIYSVAYRIVNISNIPMTSVYSAAFPKFFRLGVEGMEKTVPFAKRLVKKTSLLGLVSALGMIVCAPLIPWVMGKDYALSAEALRWLCLIPFFRSFHLSAGDAIAGAGKQKFRLYAQLVAIALNLTLDVWLIPRHSWHGAAWASLATDGTLGMLNWGVALSLLRSERRRISQSFAPTT